MNHCYLEDAGLYRATLEAMMFGAPIQESEDKGFNDSVFGKKDKKVNDLVKKFEKNLKLKDDSTVEIKEDKVSQLSKPKCRIPSMEDFVEGILRTSSPISQAPPLTETPILPYHPIRRDLDFEILDSNTTKSYRPASQGRSKIAEAKASRTKGSPDSAYHSAGSSAASTPSTSAEDQKEELDIYMKLARAKLHEKVQEYSRWNHEKLRPISIHAATIRLQALQMISEPCDATEIMMQMYSKCASEPVNKEMDVLVVSVFHLLDERVHQPQISVLEEYLVMKYCKKQMQ